jgi:uncharacterized protein (TIGR00295 family)
VIRHCCVVRSAAALLAERSNANVRLVIAGALLHDIGRSKTHRIAHVTASVDIARSWKVPESVVRIIQRHIGAGLTSEEAEALSLPPGEYMPETLEEKIVCHSDNLIDGENIISLEDAIAHFESKGLQIAAERLMAMSEEIESVVGERPDILLRKMDPLARLKGPCTDYASPR